MLEEQNLYQSNQLFGPEEMARMQAQAKRLQMASLPGPETA